MIVVLKPGVCEEKKSQLTDWLAGQGLSVHPALGGSQTILGLVGDTSRLDTSLLESLEIVDSVKPVSDPFKCCNRKFHPEDSVIQAGPAAIGGGHFASSPAPARWRRRSRSPMWPSAYRPRVPASCAAARSSPAPAPYSFQGFCVPRAWSFCRRPAL